jgi:histidinol-phosphate phosphatase family protein
MGIALVTLRFLCTLRFSMTNQMTTNRSKIKCLLLDRDGTINVDLGGGDRYVSQPKDISLIPGAGTAILKAQRAGLKLAIVTNQAGIAKGITLLENMPKIHDYMTKLILEEAGQDLPDTDPIPGAITKTVFDDVRICPHHPSEGCRCRKPGTKMVEDALSQLGFKETEAVMIGDFMRDLETAQRSGVASILVRTGHGANTEKQLKLLLADPLSQTPAPKPLVIVDDLAQAIDFVLEHLIEESILTKP